MALWLVVRTVEIVFAVGWGTFWLYWLVAAFSMKRGRSPSESRRVEKCPRTCPPDAGWLLSRIAG